MPKKLSTNTKSVEAREKKAAIKKEKTEFEDKRKEDGNVNEIVMMESKLWNLIF